MTVISIGVWFVHIRIQREVPATADYPKGKEKDM